MFWLLAASALIEAVDEVVKLLIAVTLTVPPEAAVFLLATTCTTGAWGANVRLATVVVIAPLVLPTLIMVVRPT